MLQSLPSPKATMLKVFPRQRILAAKKGTADTTVPNMDDLNLSRIDQSLTSGTGHDNSSVTRQLSS
jgi:hypothetical protein